MKPDTTPVQTTSANLTKEDYEYLSELMQSSSSTHVEQFQLSFVADIAYPHYAKLKGITLDENDKPIKIGSITDESQADILKCIYDRLVDYAEEKDIEWE